MARDDARAYSFDIRGIIPLSLTDVYTIHHLYLSSPLSLHEQGDDQKHVISGSNCRSLSSLTYEHPHHTHTRTHTRIRVLTRTRTNEHARARSHPTEQPPFPLDLVQIESSSMVGAVVRRCYFHDGFCNGARWKSSNSVFEHTRVELDNGACLPFIVGVPCAPLLCGPLGVTNVTVSSNTFVGGCRSTQPVQMVNVSGLVMLNNSHVPDPQSSCYPCVPETSAKCTG
jgi:hypothetical protein